MEATGEDATAFSTSHTWRAATVRILLPIALAAAGCAPEPRTAWLGLDLRAGPSSSATQPASAPAAAPDRDIDFHLIDELGASLARIDLMDWASIQARPQERYDFSQADAVVRRAQRSEVDLLAVWDGVPGWAVAPATGMPAREHAAAFGGFVRAFVERYDGDGRSDMPGLRRPIRTFECLPNMESVPPGEYAFWLRLFHESVKAASPASLVSIGSLTCPGLRPPDRTTGEDHTYFERLLGEAALQGPGYPCFDAVAFQNFPRRFPGRPAFEHAVVYLRQAMAARQVDRPIWLTAFGADSNDPNTGGEDRQAGDLVCWAIHARSLGIDRVYVHTLRDDPPARGSEPARACGLVRAVSVGGQAAPKPAFQAVALLLEVVKTRSHVTRRAEGIYMVADHKEPTYVLWRVPRYDASSFLIPGWWEVRTLTGQRFVRQGSEIKLTAQPVFLQRAMSPFIQ